MDTSTSVNVVSQNAAEAKVLLRDVSRVLQEAAIANKGTEKEARLFQVVETVADVGDALYNLEKCALSDQETVTQVDKALTKLREAMLNVQHESFGVMLVEKCGEPIAKALAILYAAGRSLERSSGSTSESMSALAQSVPPRSSASPRKRANAMMPSEAEHTEERASLRALADSLPSLSSPPSRAKPVLQVVPDPQSVPPPPSEAAAAEQPAVSYPPRSRRASQRVLIEADVGLVSESNFYAGLTMDVSAGGIFVATYVIRPVGTLVTLSFVLPEGYAVTTGGVVRWVRDTTGFDGTPGMGIAFQGLNIEALRHIEAFCKKRPPLYIELDDM